MVIWLFTLCTACSASSPNTAIAPAELISEIQKVGATKVIRRYWGHPEWRNLVGNVASGERDWIDVALALIPASDAGSASELHDALFRALRKNPEYILRSLAIGKAPDGRSFSISDICDGRMDPLPAYENARKELEETRISLGKIQGEELQKKKGICMESLFSAGNNLKKYYEIDN